MPQLSPSSSILDFTKKNIICTVDDKEMLTQNFFLLLLYYKEDEEKEEKYNEFSCHEFIA